MAWEKGKSGNPAGRPLGAKDKFTRKFWLDLADAWERKGIDAIERTIAAEPATFVKVAASLLPKEEQHTHEIRAVRLWTEKESLAYLTTRDLNSELTTTEQTDMPSSSATDARVKH